VLLDLEDVGYITVRLKAGDGGEAVEVGNLDLFAMSIKLGDLGREYPKAEHAGDYLRGVVDYLKSLGFPEVSLYVADAFARRVNAEVDALQKKSRDGTSPASPASTT
jgi:hypothetical protein